jgi:DNA-binding MarR family transcriptional regulator
MLELLKRAVLGTLGALSWFIGLVRGREELPKHTLEVLGLLAQHSSCTVPEISSLLHLSLGETVTILEELEQRGLTKAQRGQGRGPGSHRSDHGARAR